jgi:hypothetical protein
MAKDWKAATCLLLAFALGTALAAPGDVAVGDVRAVLPRAGAPIREQPRTLSRATTTLAHGTRVQVVERRGAWIRVAAPGGDPAEGGWLRASQTVEPFALTQGGQRGSIHRTAGAGPSEEDIQAAGRQFDQGTEDTYRQSHPDIERAFPLVDGIETSTPPENRVIEFIRAGRLGRPGRDS